MEQYIHKKTYRAIKKNVLVGDIEGYKYKESKSLERYIHEEKYS